MVKEFEDGGRRVVIKFGGSSLGGEGDLDRFSKDISLLISHGIRPVIVHGGGPEISEEMEKRGLKVRKVKGLRITDDESLKVAIEVLSRINMEIVLALQRAGVKSMGMPAGDAGTVICTKMPSTVVEAEGRIQEVDLGNVGEVSKVHPEMLDYLLSKGFVPVIFPICVTEQGQRMNVNADTVAANIAKSIGSEEIVIVTDVPGLMTDINDIGSVIPAATLKEVDELIASGAIKEGMIPKVEACRVAVKSGVRCAYMLHGKEPQVLIKKLVKGETCGTEIRKEARS